MFSVSIAPPFRPASRTDRRGDPRRLYDLLEERARDIPVAYLTGEREFMELAFEVGPGVLFRPETELLVMGRLRLRMRDQKRVTVADVGTGSGAIAISIAVVMAPDWQGRIIASDISPVAVSVAARNRARLDTHHRVALVQGSLSAWLRGPVDLMLANLPYCVRSRSRRIRRLQPSPDWRSTAV